MASDLMLALVVYPSGKILKAKIDRPDTVLDIELPEPIQTGSRLIGYVNDEAEFDGAEPNALATWIARTFGWDEGPRILYGTFVLLGRNLDGDADIPEDILHGIQAVWSDNFFR